MKLAAPLLLLLLLAAAFCDAAPKKAKHPKLKASARSATP